MPAKETMQRVKRDRNAGSETFEPALVAARN